MNSISSDKEVKSNLCPSMSTKDKWLRAVLYLKKIYESLHELSKEMTIVHGTFSNYEFLIRDQKIHSSVSSGNHNSFLS